MEPEDELDLPQDVAMVEHRELWDKRPDESQKAFDAFVRYRDAEKRSFKNVADQLNCSPQNIFQWSSRFNWRGRCDAYDVEQDRLQREELARGRIRMRDRHLRLAVALQGLAAHAVREWQLRIEQGLPLNLAPEQIALLTKCATELEHRTMGTEAEHRYTQIVVRLTDAEPPPDLPALADAMPAALCDGTSGGGVEDDRACSWKNPPPSR